MNNIKRAVGQFGLRGVYVRGKAKKLLDMALEVSERASKITLVVMTIDAKPRFEVMLKAMRERNDS